ncbi:MAG TPA: FtsQ-type POTRA domain-containing protein [Symbiobacteriaceae bacterium]|nr:FtsQ-type POTRA domain-containing protein [Symbiobacteriaceae bacterium]
MSETMGRRPAEDEPEESGGKGWFWLALLVMLSIAAIAGYRSALFRAGTIEITGLDRLPRERVLEAAGLTENAPRWEHSAADVQNRLLQDPWIAAASAVWDWGRITLDISERKAVGLLKYSDRFYLVLDQTGVILGQSELDPKNPLPVISGKNVSTALRGQQLPDPGLQDALLLLSRMNEGYSTHISEVKVAGDRSLTLYMVSGATVDWGPIPDGKERTSALDEKIKTFFGFWNGLKKRSGGCKIDMRVTDFAIPSGCGD